MGFVLQLFGGFRLIDQSGKAIVLPERGRALLAYLSVASAVVPRRKLAELLSEQDSEQEQRAVLRQAVYIARKAMADSAVICTREDNLILDNTLVSADVCRFQRALVRGDYHSLEEAIQLYNGPFLDGESSPSSPFEEWLVARRAEFLDQTMDALLKLAESDAAAGRHSIAVARAQRALTLDPLHEAAHRQVMRSLVAIGKRSSALRQYDIAQRLLAEELGVSPDAETEALREAIIRGEKQPISVAKPIMGDRIPLERVAGRLSGFTFLSGLHRRWTAVAAIIAVLAVTGATTAWYSYPRMPSSTDPPSIAVVPFVNGSGASVQDLGYGVAREIVTMLSTHPGIRVLPSATGYPLDDTPKAQQLGQQLGAHYVLEGSVQRSAQGIHVTAQLLNVSTGDQIWARQYDAQQGDDSFIQKQIANRVYESLVGFTGEIESQEQRRAWRLADASLEDHDYVLRGEQFYFQFTKDAHARAQEVWRAGLARFPESRRIRLSLAASYRHSVEVRWSEHPDQDLHKAWTLANEAALAPYQTRYEKWLSHWLMAKLAQWCKEDYELSIAEARAAIKMTPYDATSRADLAEYMANAGQIEDAIEWLQEAIRRDPEGPEWYRANLAWAYYLAGQYENALKELEALSKPRHLLLAVVYARLGQREHARAAVTDFLKMNPEYTLIDAARIPLVATLERAWLDDLRNAGLEE